MRQIKVNAAEQAGETEIIELHPARQIEQAAEIAPLVDGEPSSPP